MRQKGRRAATALVALALPALALTACGSSSEGSASSSGEPAASSSEASAAASSAPASSAAAVDPVDYSGTLSIWYPYNEGTPGLLAAITEWNDSFTALYPDVTIEGEFVDPAKFSQKLIAANATGQGPDVAFIAGPTIPDLAQAEVIADITAEWAGFADASQFPEAVLTGGNTYDGKQYAVQAFGNLEGLYVNTTMLTELGLEIPTDKASFEAALAAAKDAGKVGFTGTAMGGVAGEFFSVPFYATNGWTYQDPTNPGLQDALVTQATWVANGWRQANDASGWVGTENFLTGKYLFSQDGNWQLTNIGENAKFEWDVINVPGVQDRAVIGGESFAIGINSQNKPLAWAYISEALMSTSGGEIAAKAGSVPLRADVASSAIVTGDPHLATFAAGAAQSIAIPLTSNSAKVSALLGDTYNTVIAGQMTGEEGAQKIYDELPALLTP